MSNKIVLITDASELAKTGLELAKSIRDTDERIAIYLLSEVAHIEEHRNPTRLNQFFSRVKGSGARINAMHNFVQVFGNVDFNKDANGAIKADGNLNPNNKFGRTDESGEKFAWYYSVKKAPRFKGKPEQMNEKIITKAQEKPWYQFQPERPPQEFKVDDKVKSLLRSIWSNQLSDDPTIITTGLLADLTELAFKYGIVEKASDIISDDKVAKTPEKFKPMLHLVADNTNKTSETKAEKPAKEVKKSA